MNIGQAIKELRKEKKIKAKDLAAASTLSPTGLHNIESDKTFPTKPTIEALANALGVPVAVILIHSLTEEDIPEEKREAFKYIVEPIKQFLKQ